MNSLVRWVHQFCSADGGSHELFPVQVILYVRLLNWHAASCVFWLGSLVKQAEGYNSGANEQDYKLDSLPRYNRGSISKASKSLCHLNSSQLHPNFPGQTEPLALLCKLLAALLLTWAPLSHTVYRSGCQTLWLDRTWRYSLQWVGLYLNSFAWEGGGGLLQITLSFPNRLSCWEAPALPSALAMN